MCVPPYGHSTVAGLTFNLLTGEIKGTPVQLTNRVETMHTVTGMNTGGNGTFVLLFSVNQVIPAGAIPVVCNLNQNPAVAGSSWHGLLPLRGGSLAPDTL